MGKLTIPLLKTLCIFFVGIQGVYGQQYFVLDENSSQYSSKSYTLNTAPSYTINAEIALVNILLTEPLNYKGAEEQKTLVLFSVLPDLIEKENWTAIKLDTIQDKILSTGKLRRLSQQSLLQLFDFQYGDKTKYWNDYKLIVKRDNQYFVAKNCLLQFFAIRNRPNIFTNTYGTINTDQTPISIVAFRSIFKKTYSYANFPLNLPPNDSGFDRRRDRREYLSKEITLNGASRFFQFWTYTDWGQTIIESVDPNPRGVFAYERGIDRFIYHPEHLIVGGSFDFYFYYYRRETGMKAAQFDENINAEKVIIADELQEK